MGRAANDIASVLIPSTPDNNTLILDTRLFGREMPLLETSVLGIRSTITLDLWLKAGTCVYNIYIHIHMPVFQL